jgi:hypothetical protein
LLSKNMTLFPQWTTQPTTTYMEWGYPRPMRLKLIY